MRFALPNLQTVAETTETQIDQLKRAINNGRILLVFGVESKKSLDSEIINKLIESTSKIEQLIAQNAAIDDKTEATFWDSYEKLSDIMAPLTAESIIESRKVSRKRLGVTGGHAFISLVLFVIIVCLQGYSFVGKNLREELTKIRLDQAKIENDLNVKRAELVLLQKQSNGNIPASATVKTPDVTTRTDSLITPYDQKLNEIKTLLRTHEDQLTGIQSISHMAGLWYNFFPFAPAYNALEGSTRLNTQSVNSRAMAGTTDSKVRIEIQKGSRESTLVEFSNVALVELERRVESLLALLDRFLIPALLGALGALIYILRSFIVQIQSYSYTANLSSLTLVRVCLGMMAGLFGVVFLPSTSSTLKDLPPLAISLFLGYAVEVLFVFMDKLVGTFTSPSTSPPS